MISLTFYIEPVAKGRPRISRFGGCFTPKKTRAFETELRRQAQLLYKGEPLQGPLYVSVSFYIKKPKSVKRDYPCVKSDLDNYVKCLDALNGIVWEDDALIVDLAAKKRYGKVPGITLFVESLDGRSTPEVTEQPFE